MILYGRGAASVAEQMGVEVKEAQKVIDDFFRGFPTVKKWMDDSESFAVENGYVEDLWGRRRRLPDIQLPKFTIKEKDASKNSEFNPLLFCKGLATNKVNPKLKQYENECLAAKGRQQINAIKTKAEKDGIEIRDNSGFIAQAHRQTVNARIQGSAASMTKLAMRKIYDSKELRDLGFRMLLQVHDEIIGECPKENAEAVANELTKVMKDAAKPRVQIPFKCDADISPCWYYSDFKDNLQKDYHKLIDSGKLSQDAYNQIKADHIELTEEQVKEFLEI